MLQIIGWMGCLYLIVKAAELFSSARARRDTNNVYDHASMIGGSIALLGAIGFFFLINAQADSGYGALADGASRFGSGASDFDEAEMEDWEINAEEVAAPILDDDF